MLPDWKESNQQIHRSSIDVYPKTSAGSYTERLYFSSFSRDDDLKIRDVVDDSICLIEIAILRKYAIK
ncbi:hypothetical protein M3649_13435 [Ureibacillus chungkukjangi]|uniref:hypothetical protein n=1 Tax=Ureibacillus chungkukjangi TaxID=1202712 RepID=UPI0020422F2D|nr:hypothetical protein [Ureibacillus chungkukjangi]MCM3389139.1 hypothetical protein [Ureibacillus chungkukjangi]